MRRIVLDTNELELCLERLACQLIENHTDFEHTILVGLQPRGKYLCEKLIKILNKNYNIESVNHSLLDITFFRDDFRKKDKILIPNVTEFKLFVEDKKVVFIDDVLFTGRTIRAALTAIENFGRPKSIELLILVNRRFSRELPIQADYIGIDVDVYSDEKVNVIWKDLVNTSYVTIEKIIDG